MKLRSIAIFFALALASAAAHAQTGVYATFDAEEFDRSGVLANPPAGSSNTANPWLYGPTAGIYYDPAKIHIPKVGTLHTGPIILGVDLRGDFLRTNSQYSRDDGIISLRAVPRTSFKGIVPYIQGGAGIGHTKVPGQTTYTNNWSYQFAIGADRKLKGRIDWRVVEASAGFLGSYVAGSAGNNSNYIVTLGTGLVVRLPGK
jgi:hypothetical protein